MGMGDIADALKLGNRIVAVLERLTTNAQIKEEFVRTGKVSGSFSVSDYLIEFTVKDKKRTAIPADVVVKE